MDVTIRHDGGRELSGCLRMCEAEVNGGAGLGEPTVVMLLPCSSVDGRPLQVGYGETRWGPPLLESTSPAGYGITTSMAIEAVYGISGNQLVYSELVLETVLCCCGFSVHCCEIDREAMDG